MLTPRTVCLAVSGKDALQATRGHPRKEAAKTLGRCIEPALVAERLLAARRHARAAPGQSLAGKAPACIERLGMYW